MAGGGLLTLAIILAVLVGTWVLGGRVIARQASSLLSTHVFGPQTRLAVGRVSGMPLLGITVEDARLEVQGPNGWFSFGAAERVDAAYDLWGILHGRIKVNNVRLEGVRMEFRQDPNGGLLLPAVRGGGGGGNKPQIQITDIAVVNSGILFEVPWREIVAESLSGHLEVTLQEDVLRFATRGLAGVLADSLGALHIESGALTVYDGVGLERIVAQWDSTRLEVDGRPGSDQLALDASVSSLPLGQLGRLLLEPNLEPGWVDSMTGRIERTHDGIAFTWEGAGTWDVWDLAATRGRGLIADRVIRLLDIDAQVRGAQIHYGSVSIPLDESAFTVAGNFENLDPPEFDIPGFEVIRGAVSGSGTATFTHRSDPFADLEAQINLGHGVLTEVPFNTGRIELSFHDEVWSIDSLMVSLDRASLRGQGTVSVDSMNLGFVYLGDIEPWQTFLRQPDTRGTAFLTVGLRGNPQAPLFEASGLLQQFRMGLIESPRIEVRTALGTLTPPRDLQLDFMAPQGLRAGAFEFTAGDGKVRVTDDRIWMQGLRLEHGDTTITMEGNLAWSPHLGIEITRADALVNGRLYVVDQPGTLNIKDDVLWSDGLSLLTPRGRLNASGRWDRGTGHLAASFQVMDLDPHVLYPPGEQPPLDVSSISGSCDLEGIFPDLEGEADMVLRDLKWEGGQLDSLGGSVRLLHHTAEIDTLFAVRRVGRIGARGTISFPGSLYETLEAMAVGPDLDPETTSWDLGVDFDTVQLYEWLSGMDRRDRPAGVITGRADLSGTWGSPTIRWRGDAHALMWHRIRADSLFASAVLEDDTINIQRMRLWDRGVPVEASGTIPLDLVVYPFAASFPARDMDVRLHAAEAALDNLRFTPWIERAEGEADVDLKVHGHPRRPLLTGSAVVRNGTVQPRGRSEVVERVEALLTFDGNLVTVRQAEGTLGGGKVTAGGTYRLHASETETYEMTVRFDKAVVKEPGVYAARVSGELLLTPHLAGDGFIYPYATGDIFVHRAEYAGSLQPQDIGRFQRQPVLYDVRINAPAHIIVFTEEVNAELGGELIARQFPTRREMLGELQILRGSYQFFLNEFKITDGTLIWNDPQRVLPDLDIQAETIDQGYLIQVHLTGRADEPVLDFSAILLETGQDAGLSNDAIITRLAAGSVGLSAALTPSGATGTETTAGNRAEAVARGLVSSTGLFLAPLERRLVKQFGVDDIDIRTGMSESGRLEATIGLTKYVTPELSVIYRQAINYLLTQDIAIEYRLRRMLYLRGEARRYGDDNVGTSNEFNLDLRLRHEY